ncbi:MAG: hypothetical protein JJE15_09155 [Desulfobacteraceae bacterium]|nr:hypothetical protein [Desulfobacteraceae bacterium]
MKAPELLEHLQTTPQGLTDEDARRRLMHFGANRLKPKKRSDLRTIKEDLYYSWYSWL